MSNPLSLEGGFSFSANIAICFFDTIWGNDRFYNVIEKWKKWDLMRCKRLTSIFLSVVIGVFDLFLEMHEKCVEKNIETWYYKYRFGV